MTKPTIKISEPPIKIRDRLFVFCVIYPITAPAAPKRTIKPSPCKELVINEIMMAAIKKTAIFFKLFLAENIINGSGRKKTLIILKGGM
jgi:hypothetical protein